MTEKLMTLQEVFDEATSIIETDTQKALNAFNFLLNKTPDAKELVFYVATAEMMLQNYGVAINLFHRVISMNEKEGKFLSSVYNNLGYSYHSMGQIDKADAYFKKATDLNPGSADLFNNVASCYVNNGTPDKALKLIKQGLKVDPNHKHLKWNISLCYLEKGDYENGWKYYENGIESGHRKGRNYANDHTTPTWHGQATDDQVVVYGEQGVGDEVMYASMIPDLLKLCPNAILEGHPRLAEVYRNSFDMPIYGTRKERDISWVKHHDIKWKIPIGSLGQYFRNKKSDFPKTPYLKANPVLVKKIREGFEDNGKLKVVISWKGGTDKTNKSFRSIPLPEWAPILENDCDFISLQYTQGAMLETAPYKNISHNQKIVDDLDWQFAMLEAADLVITVNTSIVHMAGSIGKECWVLTPDQCAWRYGMNGTSMDWYGSIKQYRRKKDWKPVIEKVGIDLGKHINANNRKLSAA